MKNTIESLPLQKLWEIRDPKLQEQFVTQEGWRNLEGWLLPQALANWGRWRVILDQEGLVDIRATLKQNLKTDWDLGLWTLAHLSRGAIIWGQKRPASVNYSSLVPLILAALKRDQNLNYRSWPLAGLERVVHKPLWEVLVWAEGEQGVACRDLGSEDWIKIREQGLVTKTGKSQGKPKDPLATWTLTGLQGTPLHGAPKLASTMLCQVWVAHPSLRTGYMILDPWNWDRIPPSLWSEQLFSEPESDMEQTETNHTHKLPWE
jgi:hypothetical protein